MLNWSGWDHTPQTEGNAVGTGSTVETTFGA